MKWLQEKNTMNTLPLISSNPSLTCRFRGSGAVVFSCHLPPRFITLRWNVSFRQLLKFGSEGDKAGRLGKLSQKGDWFHLVPGVLQVYSASGYLRVITHWRRTVSIICHGHTGFSARHDSTSICTYLLLKTGTTVYKGTLCGGRLSDRRFQICTSLSTVSA